MAKVATELSRLSVSLRSFGTCVIQTSFALQEVSRGLVLNDSGDAPDQPTELAALFPEWEPVFGAAVDATDSSGDRWQFGNVTLSRLPILSSFCHPLPQPAEGGIRHMPRQATEVTVCTTNRPLRVINTHLEFHSQSQRKAQLARLRELQADVAVNVLSPPAFDEDGPYQPVARPIDCVICGDFNMDPGFEEYNILVKPTPDDRSAFQDAWMIAHGRKPHEPTCGIFDHVQWPQGPHCRDFFFIAHPLAAAVRTVAVNTTTDASDHQPLILELDF